jgi:hypothetical protein
MLKRLWQETNEHSIVREVKNRKGVKIMERCGTDLRDHSTLGHEVAGLSDRYRSYLLLLYSRLLNK